MRCLTPPIDQILIRKYVASKDLRRANKLFGVVSMLLLDYVVISMMYGVHQYEKWASLVVQEASKRALMDLGFLKYPCLLQHFLFFVLVEV
jgi:hypothetical protein